MKKFFLFKRRDVNLTSTISSDTGEGLDILAISVDHLSFISASLGKVSIVFNNATIYQESNLLDGESFKKTTVSVACEQGGEAELIDSIMNFISSDRVQTNVMRFDAVGGNTNVKGVQLSSVSDIVGKVRERPILRSTQEISTRTFVGGSDAQSPSEDNTIAGIEFGEGNKPVIDFNEDNISHGSNTVNGWTNAGSGGTTYDVQTIGGTLAYDDSTGRTNNGLKTAAADFATSNNAVLANAYTKAGEFTMYAVVGLSPSDQNDNPNFGPLVHGSSGSGSGLSSLFLTSDIKYYRFKFANEIGDFVTAVSQTSYLVDVLDPDNDKRTAYVFVIRRDANNNIYVYTDRGLSASIPANTSGNSARTDGNLVVGRIGSGASGNFFGNVPRFGVIPRDIGASQASQLVDDLYSRYAPLT